MGIHFPDYLEPRLSELLSYEFNRAEFRQRPSVMLKAKIFPDGNKWCCLYGDNLQDGVCGFGDSPELASWDFDRAWYSKIGEGENGKQ